MKIKKYTVESMKDAIAKIREDLGPDAVILHSKKTARPGAQRDERPIFEVTAAIEEHSSENVMSGLSRHPHGNSGTVGEVFSEMQELENDGDERRSIDFLINDNNQEENPIPSAPVIKPRKKKGGKALGGTRSPDAVPEISIKLSEVHQSMLDNEVDELVAESLVKTAMEESMTTDGADLIDEFLPRSLENFVRCSGPIETGNSHPKIVAFVGPTGVGKTTTTAKLATNFTVLDRKSLALITVDIQRVASVQQLKTYADMLQAPFEVALNPVELRRAIRKHSDKDLILIDTAGRSPYKWISILELAGFFKGIEDMEIHLVLSAATSPGENLSAIERFGALKISRLLFTKIDEISGHGTIINVGSKCNKPISYLATGQNIPDDIEIATYERILKLVSKTGKEKP